jgi:class 3 adenylate cyclase/tetratricopeptide (TPR) repeat protein
MNCPLCGERVARSMAFCGQCGTPLPWFCQTCGRENAPNNRFCGHCGVARAAKPDGAPASGADTNPTSTDAERRHLTVMFADMVGSTPLSARLDPEDLRDTMDAWRTCVTGLISRYGGLVTRYMGDGNLALFGYPRAHEADAERAVRAGLAIIEAVGQLRTVAGPPGTLTMRVGLATGLVIVGDLIGAGSSLEYSVVGETPNLAARLQTLAQPGTVVIDEVTRQLTGGMFEYASLGPTQLKGIPTVVEPWLVLRESSIESRFEALRTGRLPLVGRTEETDLLQRRWARTQTGSGHAVVVVGEPGVGKSRLIAAFEEQLSSTRRSVMRLLCSPSYQETPLYPLIRYFESAAGFQRSDSPAEKFSKLQRLLEDTSGLGEEEIAWLADLLSIAAPGEMLTQRTAQHTRDVTFKAVFRHIEALAAKAPLLAIVEDLHWADPTTVELLDSLVQQLDHVPTLLVISTRPERALLLSLYPQVTTQLLNRLDRNQAAVLVRHVAGEHALADEIVRRIVKRSEGVPLFLEELTRSLLSSGATNGDGDRLAEVLPASDDAVPTTLNALLMARLDLLGPGKEAAQASSVIGREFSFETLQAVSAVSSERLELALDELEEAGLIATQGQPPQATYVFHHALIQEAAYASMLRERRRAMHLRYAETLERDPSGPASTAPEMLAAQFAMGGAAEKSIDYYLKAAARATGRFALTEIIGYLRKGVSQLGGLGSAPATQQRELALQVALGQALREQRGGGVAEVRAAFERADALCQLLGGTEELLRVHEGLANYHLAHSEFDKVVEYAERALEVGRRTGNVDAVVLGHRSSGHAKLYLGRLREARDHLEQALSQYTGRNTVTRDPKVSVCSALGICLTLLGLPDSGLAISHAGLRHAEMLAHPVSLNLGIRRACVQGMMWRDASQVLELSNRLLENHAQYETFNSSREGAFFVTWAQLQTDRDAALLKRLRTTLDGFESASQSNLLTFFVLAAAEAQEAYGDREGADALLSRAAELVEKTNERWCEPEIFRLRARLTGDPVVAAALLESSLSVARAQGAVLWEVRAATDLAKLLHGQGRRETADAILVDVLGRMTEGMAMPDFIAARELGSHLTQPA